VWGCLGNVIPPVVKKPKVTIAVPLTDLITKAPITAVTAKVCAKIDVNCSTPLQSGVVPDSNGVLTFSLDAGFDGFVLIQPMLPDAGCPIDAGQDAATCYFPLVMASLVFFNPPLVDDTTYITIPMLSLDTLTTLAKANGDTVNTSLGSVFMEAVDCSFHAGKDVAVSLDSTTSETRGFYLIGGIPSLTASATDTSGYAGFINTPIGVRTVSGVLKPDSKFIGKISVFARPGFISYTTLAPSQP
jgi:hypothetical protein